jgi:hypothetical protein
MVARRRNGDGAPYRPLRVSCALTPQASHLGWFGDRRTPYRTVS